MIGFLKHIQELMQRVAELLRGQVACGLNIKHWNQVLFTRQALCLEVIELQLQIGLRTKKMIRAYLQAEAMSQINISLILRVDTVATFCCLQIDVGHLRTLTHRFPKHFTLVMTHVDTMHMRTGILTDQVGILMNRWWHHALLLHHTGGTCTFLGTLTRFGTCVDHSHKTKQYCQKYR